MVTPALRKVHCAPLYKLFGNVLCVACARPAYGFWPGAFVTHSAHNGYRCVLDPRATARLDDQAQSAAHAHGTAVAA